MVFDMRTRGLAARWGTSLVASALFATLLVFAGVMQREEAPAAPSAATTYLCSGYSSCVGAGYSDAGYGAVSGKMYWQMYSGHNCTNYAAYRVIKAGGPATRPWVGNGNASEWGLRMASITDQVPNVGAIAWWGRYSNGSGSAGHVAYVEKVVSPTEIIISEDSWGGTFHWRRITKSSGRWPTGFIHFTDKRLSVTKAPAVTGGAAQIGTPLGIDPGTWSPSARRTVQWLADGVAIPGATGGGFTPTLAQLGKAISVRVTGTRDNYNPLTVTTRPTADVVRGEMVPAAPPTLNGEPYLDEVLTATEGSWKPLDPTIEWRWYVDGVRLTDHAAPNLALTPEYVGKKVTLLAVARKPGYLTKTAVAQGSVGPILAGRIALSAQPRISGVPEVGATVKAVTGTPDPADAVVTHQWLRNGRPIAGATGATYKLTGADASRTIGVRTTVTKPRYETLVADATMAKPVMATPVVDVATVGWTGKAVVRVRVVAKGVAPVKGSVRITVGSRVTTAKLVDGVAKVTLGPIRAGRRDVTVVYLGSTSVRAAKATASVVVR